MVGEGKLSGGQCLGDVKGMSMENVRGEGGDVLSGFHAWLQVSICSGCDSG